jgi:antitoxin MazE
MLTKVQKWGNSLGLRIPKSFAEEASVEEGSTVDLSVSNGELLIRPVHSKNYELKELLSEVCEENIHSEVSTGDPQGREGW